MAHRYRSKPPTTRMYRHFAVVTVVVTGLLAVFAEGEKAELHAATVEHRDLPAEAADVVPARPATVRAPGGVWGSDATSFAASAAGSIDWSANSGPAWGDPSGGGYTSDYLAGLSETDRAALEAAMAENAAGSPGESRARLARLEAASRLRSGSVGRE